MVKPHLHTVLIPHCGSTMSGRPDADNSMDGRSPPTISQAVSASQAQSQRAAAAAAADKADVGTKVQKDAMEAHLAICVRKEMVKVALMKLKVDVQMVKGRTRPRDEDTAVQRQQSLAVNPLNRPLSYFLIWQDECLSNMGLRSTFPLVTRCSAFFRQHR